MPDDAFFDPQTICGFYVSEKRKRIWAVGLDLLQKLLEVCDKHGLKCFIAHGTLLGAVRHKGFIPWDEDIDVNMPRGDYEILKSIAPQEFRYPYFFQDESGADNCFYGYGKLRNSNTTGMATRDISRDCNNGIPIDIFPMDGVFEDTRKRAEQGKRIEYYRNLMYAKIYGNDFSNFGYITASEWNRYKTDALLMTVSEISNKFVAACSECSYESAERVGIHSGKTEYECCYWYKSDFEELTYLDFEYLRVPAPKNYERCLAVKWNDYMRFPPESERGYKHVDIIFDPDVPYKIYDASRFTEIFNGIEHKDILIFGAGFIFDDYMEKYADIFSPVCIFDNDAEKWGSARNGIKIKPPEELLKFDMAKSRLIITSLYFEDIGNQLESMGIFEHYIYMQGRRYF